MGTRQGSPPRPGSANAILMETLSGFPFLPALWLHRAKPGSAKRGYGPVIVPTTEVAKFCAEV
jgi:hypothetical protein